MTDDNPEETTTEKRSLVPFSLEEMLDYINHFWKDHKCERCDNETWSIDREEPFAFIPISDGAKIGTITHHVLPTYAVTCQNCGNVRMIAVNHILRWISDKARENGRVPSAGQ